MNTFHLDVLKLVGFKFWFPCSWDIGCNYRAILINFSWRYETCFQWKLCKTWYFTPKATVSIKSLTWLRVIYGRIALLIKRVFLKVRLPNLSVLSLWWMRESSIFSLGKLLTEGLTTFWKFKNNFEQNIRVTRSRKISKLANISFVINQGPLYRFYLDC